MLARKLTGMYVMKHDQFLMYVHLALYQRAGVKGATSPLTGVGWWVQKG